MDTELNRGGLSTSGTSSGQGEEGMKAKASKLTDSARHRAMSAVDEQKSHVCELLDRTADTMEDDPIGQYAADYARRGSDFLRHHSADDMFRSARTELGSRPGLLLSACFVAGLALARVMRGSAEGTRGLQRDEPWRGAKSDYARWGEERTWPDAPRQEGQPTWRGGEI